MNNKQTNEKPSAAADKPAQVERLQAQAETAAVMLSDILNTIEANDFSFVSLRWIHMHGKAALAVLEQEAR
jgi:hypothetical protein